MTDVRFYETEGWTQLFWMNSGGTRAKRILQDTEGNQYYFKRSEKKEAKEGKPEKYYKYEFWSEVIAYQLGHLLGLNVLRYDVAEHEGVIGCLSPIMIDQDKEQLLEIGRFMTAYNPEFLPEKNESRKEYTFELLEQTLQEYKLEQYWDSIFEVILFDAIIGNTDRHQENWAIIGKQNIINKSLSVVEVISKDKEIQQYKIFNSLVNTLSKPEYKEGLNDIQKINLKASKKTRFAPIYDNGSSLARELEDTKIDLFLKEPYRIEKYIRNGPTEIHWLKEKISHFQLIEKLMEGSYCEGLVKSSMFLQKWNIDNVREMVYSIDNQLPRKWTEYRIPQSRKELIVKLLTLRTERLRGIINARV